MKFGIFYEHQLPRPWDEGSELQLIQDALDQVELADQLGFDVRVGGRAPLPRGVLALQRARGVPRRRAASAPRTSASATASSRPRRSTTTRPAPPSGSPCSTSCRTAGSSSAPASRRPRPSSAASASTRATKREAWLEGLEVALRCMTETPFTGVDGQFVHDAAPQRRAQAGAEAAPAAVGGVLPPRDDPAGRREGHRRAHVRLHRPRGGRALGRPTTRRRWPSGACPSARRVNPNVACVTPMMCAPHRGGRHRARASRAATSSATRWPTTTCSATTSRHRPTCGRSSEKRAERGLLPRDRGRRSSEERLGAKVASGDTTGLRGAIGTPDQLREYLAPLRGGRRRPADLRDAGRQEPPRAHLRGARAVRHARCCPSSRSATSAPVTAKAKRLAPDHRGGHGPQGRHAPRRCPTATRSRPCPEQMVDALRQRAGQGVAREVRRGLRRRRRHVRLPAQPMSLPTFADLHGSVALRDRRRLRHRCRDRAPPGRGGRTGRGLRRPGRARPEARHRDRRPLRAARRARRRRLGPHDRRRPRHRGTARHRPPQRRRDDRRRRPAHAQRRPHRPRARRERPRRRGRRPRRCRRHDRWGAASSRPASVAGLIGWAVDPIYTLSKHAVVGLVRALDPSSRPSASA